MNKFLFSLAIAFVVSESLAQVDTEFWFAPPEVSSGHGDTPIYLRISTLDKPATVKVSQPARGNAVLATVTIQANSTYIVYLTHQVDNLETRLAATVLNTGILIQSSSPVTAYYEVGATWNTDIFTLKGKNALGNRFVIPGQNIYDNGSYVPAPTSSFDIVATRDNTVVKVRPTQALAGHQTENVITIKLNKGQTYSLRKVGFLAAANPIGTVVESNKPIAITLKDDSAMNGFCADLMGDQLVPVEVAGTEYVVLRGFLQSQEYIFITAIDDNTDVFIEGLSSPAVSLNRGEVYRHPITLDATYLRSTRAVYVVHITGFGCEMGMALLPSINCRGSDQIGFTRTTSEFFGLNILVEKDGIEHFRLNGSNTLVPSSAFAPVAGTNDQWYSAQLSYEVSQVGVHYAATITNDVRSFQIGIINGAAATSCRYGYFSSFSTLFIGDDVAMCEGETTILDAGDDKDAYLWSTGETTPAISVQDAGEYWVRATRGGCVLYDTVAVGVTTGHLDLGPDLVICPGDTARIDGQENFSWNWSDGSADRYLETMEPGVYSVTVHDYTGCVASDEIGVSVKSLPEIELGENVVKCPRDTASLGIDLPGATFQWNTDEESTSIQTVVPGLYWVNVFYEGCVLSDSVSVENLPGPPQDTIYGSPSVCPYAEKIHYWVDEMPEFQYEWLVSGGTLNEIAGASLYIDWAEATVASVKAIVTDNAGCRGDTILFGVRVNPELVAELPDGPDSLCLNSAGDVLYSTGATNGSVYTWSIEGGEILDGQGSAVVRVAWQEGMNRLFLEESSTTIDTVCRGTSPVLEVYVFADRTKLDLDFVTIDTLDHRQSVVFWTLEPDLGSHPDVDIFRHHSGMSGFEKLGTVAFGASHYIDTHEQTDVLGYYVTTINSCAEEIMSPIHATILLNGVADTTNEIITLGWSQYVGWGDDVERYEVWRKLDDADGFRFLAEVPDGSSSVSGPWTVDGFQHAYVVRAVHKSGTSTWSNPVSFTFENSVYIPNIFSPNDDAWNQFFVIRKIELYPKSLFVVTDRWGRVVYEKRGYQNDWDGGGLSSGVYYYYLQLGENRPSYKGIINLRRAVE